MANHDTFEVWKQNEEIAEQMLAKLGRLYRNHGVLVEIYGMSLVRKNPVEILKAHRHARRFTGQTLDISTTNALIDALLTLNPGPARIDLGSTAVAWEEAGRPELAGWLTARLSDVAGKGGFEGKAQDVILYGFGRIGRLMARLLIQHVGGGDKHRLRAIVVRPKGKSDLEKRASLLRRDSVHGPFSGTIEVDHENNALIVNGQTIHVIHAKSPDTVDYTEYGIDNAIVVDNTGVWRDRDGLGLHLQSKGVSKVILTAPGKGDVPNIVFGINEDELSADERVISAASCTTNAIVPVLKVMNDKFGIEAGHLETIHAYTNDQNLIDNFHKKARRGRAAALNMVITETGAANAVAKALPELAGVLSGSAIRVPTPNVSLAILNLTLGQEVTKEEVNDYLRGVAMDSPLQRQIDYTNSPDVVSSDLVGNRHAGIVDAQATQARGRKLMTLYTWYDNEFGYSCQVMRLLEHVAGLGRVEVG